MSKHYFIDNDKMADLACLWQAAKPKDKKRLAANIISSMMFMVYSRIKPYRESPMYGDLLQEGKLGILKALEDFNQERCRNFCLFANWHIKTKVRRCIIREKNNEEVRGEPEGSYFITSDVVDNKIALQRALSFLPDNDRRVLVMRFGFDGNGARTFRQIGDALGISKQRVQQIESAALNRLRNDNELLEFFYD